MASPHLSAFRLATLLSGLLLASTLMLPTRVFAREPRIAIYIEHDGKVIELFSDAVSPLDEGTGAIVYTAIEGDDLSSQTGLRMIGWRREGDTIVIHTGYRNNPTYRVPASSLKYSVVEKLSDDELPPDEVESLPKPVLKTTHT